MLGSQRRRLKQRNFVGLLAIAESKTRSLASGDSFLSFTPYWSGKEYQVSYVRGDLARLVLLSLSGDDSGERYTVHPFEIGGNNKSAIAL